MTDSTAHPAADNPSVVFDAAVAFCEAQGLNRPDAVQRVRHDAPELAEAYDAWRKAGGRPGDDAFARTLIRTTGISLAWAQRTIDRIFASPAPAFALSERTDVTMADTKSANAEVADLVKQYRAEHPDSPIDAAFAAVKAANPDLWNKYSTETQAIARRAAGPTPKPAVGQTSNQDGAAMTRAAGKALPDDHQQLGEDSVGTRYAQARARYMEQHGLSGAKGLKAADQALKLSEPELYAAYARSLTMVVR